MSMKRFLLLALSCLTTCTFVMGGTGGMGDKVGNAGMGFDNIQDKTAAMESCEQHLALPAKHQQCLIDYITEKEMERQGRRLCYVILGKNKIQQ